jgi:pimeloyl-ACP methyl ester carboxylesterase
MPVFDSDGVEIAYETMGEGEPILLIHGFASNRVVNWVSTGWTNLLAADGRQVIAIDNRGHGESEKLHDPAAYGAPVMADDAARLLRHLGHGRADVMGYSMGARIAAFLAMNHPSLVRSAVFAGLGERMITGVGGAEAVARALEAESVDEVTEPGPRAFRLFADATGSDRLALAACMRSSRQKITAEALGEIAVPVLVAVGTEDDIAGLPEPLAAVLRDGRALAIPGRDHMKAVGDRVYKQGVLDFLSVRP